MRKERNNNLLTSALYIGLVFVFLFSVKYGALQITTDEIFSALQKYRQLNADMALNERIFMDIRLPRALLCVFVGAALAVGGALLQGLFRNPIIEPGMVGTSSGAAFGSALYFVLGASMPFFTGEWALPITACLGAVLATVLVFMLSTSNTTGKSSIIALLLTGIAINALFMSGVGFLSYTARDPQARSITFWGLGTFSGANWHSVWMVGSTTVVCVFVSMRFGKQLNAMMMGEEEAMYMGVHTKRLKTGVLTVNVVMVAVATAFVGIISFLGLIVPHLVRMVGGSDHRLLMRNAVPAGALFMCITDLVARVVVSPAELPISIVSSVVGVPVFIYLLKRKNYFF